VSPLDRSVAPPPGPLRPFHFPEVQRGRLASGVEVIVAEKRDLPVATLDLVLPSGGSADPEALAGAASLTAGLLESGAGERDAAAVAEAVDGLGLSLETGVSWDWTVVGFTSLSSRLDAGAEILADLVLRPRFPEREVERIREERLAALLQRRSDPSALADELVGHFTFAAEHPFSRRLGGLRRTISAIGPGAVSAFHAERYRPLGAALCAAGDVTLDEVVALAERHLGGWEGAPPPFAFPEPARRFDRPTVLLADRPGAVQSEVRVGHIGIERGASDFLATTVMNAILGGLFSSRLNLKLREQLGYTYGVHSSFSPRRRAGGFVVASAVQVEGTGRAVAEILSGLRSMQAEPVSAAELDDARNYLAGVFPLTLQTTDALAGRLASLPVYGLDDDYWERYRDRLLAVTAAEVLEAAGRRLHPDRAVIVVVGDAERTAAELERAAEAELLVVDPREVLA
jgi:zinc protease